MSKRIISLLSCLAIVQLASCSKSAAPPTEPPATASGPASKDATPSCAVESARDLKLDDGVDLRVWTLKASGLKRLTARLLIAKDGNVQTANEVEYMWDKWEPTAPAATGQLVLLIQDGKAFGVKGKRLPLATLEVQGSPSHSKIAKKMGLLLEGELHSLATSASISNPLNRQGILYTQLFTPSSDAVGTFALSSNRESLATASMKGRTAVAVELEWTPQ